MQACADIGRNRRGSYSGQGRTMDGLWVFEASILLEICVDLTETGRSIALLLLRFRWERRSIALLFGPPLHLLFSTNCRCWKEGARHSWHAHSH